MVDWSAAELMFPLLPYIASRRVPSDEIVDALIASPGIQVWLRHAGIHGGLTEARYREIIKRAATAPEGPTQSSLADRLRRQASREHELARVLAAFKALNFEGICQDAYAWANEHLAEAFSGQVKVYLMCATRGSAIVLDQNIAIDIADYLDPKTRPLNLDSLKAVLAHEVFHMGRERVSRAGREALPDNPGVRLAGMLLEEGVATYLFTQDYMAEQVGQPWADSLVNLPDMTRRFSEVLAAALGAAPGDQEILSKCYAFFGIEGYALGCEMCRAIDSTLGRSAMHESLRDPAAFIESYEAAVDAGALPLPRFPKETVTRLKAMV
jgi:uncharacterized protein YjaZ